MRAILNDNYVFNTTRAIFTNEVINIYPRDYPINLYVIISAMDKFYPKLAPFMQRCTLCHKKINTTVLSYDKIFLHDECYNVINKILTNSPLFVIKLLINNNGIDDCISNYDGTNNGTNNIKTLPVYYYRNNMFITCNGTYIENWGISTELTPFDTDTAANNNKYTFISAIAKHNSEIKYCHKCLLSSSTGYKIDKTQLCQSCGYRLMRFKNNLINKYMCLGAIIIKDINIQIIRAIIDIYTCIV